MALVNKRDLSGMTADLAASGVAAEELKQFVERVERLEEEKKAIAGDIREIYAEMKGRGFDVRAVREIIKIRRQDHSQRKEMEAILDLYMTALNMAEAGRHPPSPGEAPVGCCAVLPRGKLSERRRAVI